jgi:hypothetical protein
MKALGVTFNSNLKWDDHAEKALAKGKALTSVFKFLRKYMTESQLLQHIVLLLECVAAKLIRNP